jgi:TonB family protein
MRLFLILVLGSAVFADPGGNALALLQEVSDTAKATQSWRIEVTIETSDYGGHDRPASFALLIRSPGEVRFEQTGGSAPGTVVCNQDGTWVYSQPLNRYRMRSSKEASLCPPIVGDWAALPTTLESPSLAGHRRAEIDGQALDCQLVRGFSEPEEKSSGRIKREVCIDIARKVILWERSVMKGGHRTYAFSRVDRNVAIEPSVFAFVPPARSGPTPYEVPILRPPGSLAMPFDLGVSAPRVRSNEYPQYDEESRRAHIQGTVVLYVVIDVNGLPGEIQVLRSLSPQLDAAAIRSLQRWRFFPAMKGNMPVAVGSLVEVNFKML